MKFLENLILTTAFCIAPVIGFAANMAGDPANGATLFAEKGCVSCHSVNGTGGDDAPALDLTAEWQDETPFDVFARMWEDAPGMIAAREDEMGGQVEFTGAELADIVAFLQDKEAQKKFTLASLPDDVREMLEHHHEDEEHEEEGK